MGWEVERGKLFGAIDGFRVFILEEGRGVKDGRKNFFDGVTPFHEGVIKVYGDMCEYNMQQIDNGGLGSIKKRTAFTTNSPEIAKRVARQCAEGHRHIELINGRPKTAEVYPDELCKQILECTCAQMRKDGRLSTTGQK